MKVRLLEDPVKLTLRKAVSFLLLAIVTISLFCPWIYIGIKRDNGDLNLNSVMTYLTNDSITEFKNELISDITYNLQSNNTISAKNVRTIKSLSRTMDRIVNHLKDSKLSAVGLVFTSTDIVVTILKLNNIAAMDGETFVDVNTTGWLILAAIVLWVVIIAVIQAVLTCIICELKGRKHSHIGVLVFYSLMFIIVAVVAIVVNVKMGEELNGISFIIGTTNTALIHLRFFAFFGTIMAAAYCFLPRYIPESEIIAGRLGNKKPWENFSPDIDILVDKVGWTCSCGTFNMNNKKFCPNCGKKREAVTTCKKCGAELSSGTKFCASCGEPVVVVRNDLCKNCGKKLKKDAQFCAFCGEKVGDIPVVPPSETPGSAPSETPRPMGDGKGTRIKINKGNNNSHPHSELKGESGFRAPMENDID